MTESDIDDILLKICSLRHSDEVNKFSFAESDCLLIAQRAASQGVAAWALNQLNLFYTDNESLVPLRQSLKGLSLASLADSQRKCSVFFKIVKILSDSEIRVSALKGIAMMMGYYPDISFRTVGDIDLLVAHADAYRAHSILLQHFPQEMRHKARTNILSETIRTHLPGLMIDDVLVELHYNIYSADNSKRLKDGFEQHIKTFGEGERAFSAFDEPLMLYHLATHAVKSRRQKGLRLNWLTDFFAILNVEPEMAADFCANALKINEKANKDIVGFLQRVVSLLPENISSAICKNLNISEIILDKAYLLNTHEGTKTGRFRKVRALNSIIRGMSRELKKQKGLSAKWHHLKDMLHDIATRKR
ncbi:MAG: nucleotidyltransferase family protein [Bacteroidales bacterium]|nr:nucleotidyltransferase family protein [Bacteroidales bacterium]